MEPQERIVSFPGMGKEYNIIIKGMLESLGLKVIPPSEVTDKVIKVGVRNSADMMCYPFKTTLGSFVDSIERGANTLLMYDSCGQCRLKHYNKLHELTLREMGYEFEMYPVSIKSIVPTLKKLSGKSTIKCFRAVKSLIKNLRETDKRKYQWSSDKLNIGIIGEIYTCCEERVNYHLEKKLKELGVNPYNTASLSEFIYESLYELNPFHRDEKDKYKKQAKAYLNGKLGGHGVENIYNLLWMIDLKLDGVIHLLPLSCMPEATVEPILNKICRENKIPLLRLAIDEVNSEANVSTRVETFIDLIKRKRGMQYEKEMLVRN